MAKYSFRKAERLLAWPEFQNVLNNGRKKRINSICTVAWLPNQLGRKRWGIVASRKVGIAVARNRAKRKIREIFRLNKHKIKPALDIVIIVGKRSIDLPFSILEKKIVQVLEV